MISPSPARRHFAKHGDVAVAGQTPLPQGHARSPDRRRICSSWAIWSNDPSRRTRPRCSTVTGAFSSRTKLMSCSMMMTDRRGRPPDAGPAGRSVRLFRGHARRRFVEQQEFHLVGQQQADLQPLPLAVRGQELGGRIGALPSRIVSAIRAPPPFRLEADATPQARGFPTVRARTRPASGTCARCRLRPARHREAGDVAVLEMDAPRGRLA